MLARNVSYEDCSDTEMRGIQITPGYMAIKSSEILEELASLRIQYVRIAVSTVMKLEGSTVKVKLSLINHPP